MSITFTSDCAGKETEEVSPCLCTQQSEAFFIAMREGVSEGVRAELATAAHEKCPNCGGSGVEVSRGDDRPAINFSNSNAHALQGLLGFEREPDGEVLIADARRALLRARNTSRISSYERPGEALYGKPRDRGDGVVQLRPLRFFDPGLTREDLEDRLTRFASFVEDSSRRGATRIRWY